MDEVFLRRRMNDSGPVPIIWLSRFIDRESDIESVLYTTNVTPGLAETERVSE